jgi:ArsR family transcriptional regulator, arsenate/arsenite/antimonite-responsive transcriptional repressor
LASRTAIRPPAAPADPDFEMLAALAKALAHPARLRVVATLLRRDSCIGCDIVEEIGLAPSTTSEHLRILKQAGLIVGEIARPRVCYSLNPTAVAPLRRFLGLIEGAAPAPLRK